ncbi:hypothetical protein [Algibacter mikhailovii]|uniref:T9SS type A sorting domain-containing protein n=1 Tax=Algibacter mikhailovii TaxID=425498 RepID=A0A918QT78_9FLAO|nr:hypothetical protein [Algibacter mikhailovii]GGZ70863.1 hypothetical protein GCM10007028_05090 [Algibacter mikhailovii]
MTKNILEKILNSSKNTLLALTTLATVGTASAQEFGNGNIILNTADNQTSAYTITGEKIGDTFSETRNGTLGTPTSYAQWPVTTLGVEDDRLEASLFKSPLSKDFTVYAKLDDTRHIKAQMIDMQGRVVGNMQPTRSQNGYTQLFFDGSQVADGIYIAQITAGNQSNAFKVPLQGQSNGVWQPRSFQNNTSKSSTAKGASSKEVLANNYTIHVEGEDINNTSFDVEVVAGTNPDIVYTVVPANGDVAFEPILYGRPIANTTITVENQNTPSEKYTQTVSGTQAIFENVFVTSPNHPDTYIVTVTSNEGKFLPTTSIEHVNQDIAGEKNGSNIINVNTIPNKQDVTTYVYDYKTLEKEAGVTVQVYKSSDDSLVDTQVSDATGAVTFDNLPGETAHYLKVSKSGHYTKTNGDFTTPLVDLISEMKDTINVTTVPKFDYSNGTQATAEEIKEYMKSTYNTELLNGHWNIYVPEGSNRNTVITELENYASQIGLPGAIIIHNTPFAEPSQEIIDNYNPYQDANTYPGQIGTNITNLTAGTDTNPIIRILPNGNQITYNTSIFDLGNTTEKREH